MSNKQAFIAEQAGHRLLEKKKGASQIRASGFDSAVASAGMLFKGRRLSGLLWLAE